MTTTPASAPPASATATTEPVPDPELARMIAACDDHFKNGRISRLWDGIEQMRRIPGPRSPGQRNKIVFLTLASALYGYGDLDAARRINRSIVGRIWAPMRYRLSLRLGDFATASRIRKADGITDRDRWDFNTSLGLYLMWHQRFRWGFKFYQDRWRAINFPKIKPRQLEYQAPDNNPAKDPPLLVLEQGVGEILLALMHIKEQSPRPATIVGSPKMERLVKHILPGTRFLKWDAIPEGMEGRKAVFAADIVARAWYKTGSISPPGPLVRPLRDIAAGPVYGICWRGGSGQNRREERHIPLPFFLDQLPRNAVYVPLQFDITEEERALLAKDDRCQPALIDVSRDPLEVLELVRRLAGVISVDSANWHFAAAADVPMLALMNKTSHWFWGREARAESVYRTATTIAKEDLSANRVRKWMRQVNSAYKERPHPARPAPPPHTDQLRPEDRPVLMAGLPRTGSSMSMEILARHGVWLGPTMAGNAANPRGFFENTGLKQKFLKDILQQLGADPGGVTPLPPEHLIPILPGLARALHTELTRQGYTGRQPWAFKDPKLTLLWPLFARALPEAIWVIPTRNRQAVLNSLSKAHFMRRHSTSPDYWAMFCASYDQRLDALRNAKQTVIELDTDALARGERDTMNSVLERIGLTPDPAIFDAVIDSNLFGRTGKSEVIGQSWRRR